MELRQIWNLLRRRWLFAVVPALVALVAGLATYQPPATAYNVGVRFIVGQDPAPAADQEDEERYYNWLASEYIVNGLTDWVRGGQFARLVSDRLQAQGLDVPPGAVQGGLAADNTRSMMVLSLTYGDPVVLEQMMRAAIAVLQTENHQGLPQLGDEPAEMVLLDDPIVNPLPVSLRTRLDLVLRVLVALGAGIFLAFAVDYVDPTIRQRRDLENIGLPVLGEIPKK